MTKTKITPQFVQPAPPKPHQFREYDVMNGFETFVLPKLSFSFNQMAMSML